MATVLALPRSLHAIITDLATTRLRIATLDALAQLRDLTGPEDAEMARLDDRRKALEAEAKAAVYAATGVSWELLERALA